MLAGEKEITLPQHIKPMKRHFYTRGKHRDTNRRTVEARCPGVVIADYGQHASVD
jgi:hypothetical protein